MSSAKVFLTLEILAVVFLVNVREKRRAGLLSGFLSTVLRAVKEWEENGEMLCAFVSAVLFKQMGQIIY